MIKGIYHDQQYSICRDLSLFYKIIEVFAGDKFQ
ncbi:MAG: hypothetical protein KatS3mg028_1622 [Bacteroidia bacterium]|nr:MAG: hypothetical protein KatS3mg028_1622 [Bacteroidia bacterium]